jgi:DNA (cytosine-5)-methyltransferase 1
VTRPAYYNEFDKDAAAWLRVLIDRNLIAPGDVDERSILEVKPDDIRGYGQCHFFAGIGGWSLALRLAGVPDDRPVWSGSCPCQPFSAAGKQRGSNDERHLWPAFFDLIRECRPASVVGEQVAGAAGLAWLDHVCADLEGAGYAAAAADLCAAGIGAPQIRQRLYWVAHANAGAAGERRDARSAEGAWLQCGADADGRRDARGLADVEVLGCRQGCEDASGSDERTWPKGAGLRFADHGGGCMANATKQGSQRRHEPRQRVDAQRAAIERASALDTWADVEWLQCSDGKARPTQRGLFPLASRLPEGLVRGGYRSLAPDADESAEGRVMRLRGYGNAIVPPLAAAFLMAALEAA